MLQIAPWIPTAEAFGSRPAARSAAGRRPPAARGEDSGHLASWSEGGGGAAVPERHFVPGGVAAAGAWGVHGAGRRDRQQTPYQRFTEIPKIILAFSIFQQPLAF